MLEKTGAIRAMCWSPFWLVVIVALWPLHCTNYIRLPLPVANAHTKTFEHINLELSVRSCGRRVTSVRDCPWFPNGGWRVVVGLFRSFRQLLLLVVLVLVRFQSIPEVNIGRETIPTMSSNSLFCNFSLLYLVIDFPASQCSAHICF